MISFCGGEPLERDDIGNIIAYCRLKKIAVVIISNGCLVPLRIDDLKGIQFLRLSMDGPREIQDSLRGQGAYDSVMRAVESAKKQNIKVGFNVTLSRMNLDCVDFLLAKSRELKIGIKFSPLKYTHAGEKNIEILMPSVDAYRAKIDFLIREAKHNKYILNSISALQYMRLYPHGKTIAPCIGGRVFCHIKPNGDMYPCEGMQLCRPCNCVNDGVEKAFVHLKNSGCAQCWCTGTLELNMLYQPKLSAWMRLMKNSIGL